MIKGEIHTFEHWVKRGQSYHIYVGYNPVVSRLLPLFTYMPVSLVSLLMTNTKTVNVQYYLYITSTYITHSTISSSVVMGNGLRGRGGGGTLLFFLAMVIFFWISRRFCLSVFLRELPSASNG